MALTQKQIAAHLGVSQKTVSIFLRHEGLDWRRVTLDEVRCAYLGKLREQAETYCSEQGSDLVHERTLTERVDRELKEFTLAEKKSQLINVAQLEPELIQMVDKWRSELLACDDKLKADLDRQYGVDVDVKILNAYTFAAFTHLARYDASHSGNSLPI